MVKGKVRKLFPGGNTSLGFFSYYDYILDQEEAKRIIVIKGGPGVGKSSFMRKLADEMVDRGYDVEHMHCSSDNNSLDGVVFPSIKVALLDGTAPHVVDPKNPGAVDEIIHLGDFWDEDGLRVNRNEIIKCNMEVGRLFARAYKYVKASYSIYEDTALINNLAIDRSKVNAISTKVVNELFKDKELALSEGRQRHLFASAITPGGLKNYLETILTTKKVYVIRGDQSTYTEKLLERVRSAAVERGYYVESFYCALNPKKLEHIVIPQIDISFTTSNQYHDAKVTTCEVIDFNEYRDVNILSRYKDELNYNKAEFEELLNKAIETISKAKALHDDMESYYIPNMDFESVQTCWEATLARILQYADEK